MTTSTFRLVTVSDASHAAIHGEDEHGIACGHTNHQGVQPAVVQVVAELPDGAIGTWPESTAALAAAHVPVCRLCRRCWGRVKGAAIPAHTRACWRPQPAQES